MSDTYAILLYIYKGINREKNAFLGSSSCFCREKRERETESFKGCSLLFFILFAVSKKEVRSIMILCMLTSIDTDVCVFLVFFLR